MSTGAADLRQLFEEMVATRPQIEVIGTASRYTLSGPLPWAAQPGPTAGSRRRAIVSERLDFSRLVRVHLA